jgi:hypothetical protein
MVAPMDDVTLPTELRDDPLSRLAQREAGDKELAAISENITAGKEQLRRLSERAQSREIAAKKTVIIAVIVVTLCALLSLLSLMYSSKLIVDARADRNYAAFVRKRQQSAELNARQHTFGAHFDPTVNGWFIDFPFGTAFRVVKLEGLPAIQVLPHGR